MTWLCWTQSKAMNLRILQLFVFVPLVDQETFKGEFEDYQRMEDTEICMEEGGVQKPVDR